MCRKLFLAAMVLSAAHLAAYQQPATPNWTAMWIATPGTSPDGYGIYHFRKAFELTSKPDHFAVHISGDNRYQLFVNGARVAWGPARGDLTHWRYETVNLAKYLHVGRNVLAAVVWNFGPYRALAQITNRSGFLLQADRQEDAAVNTDRSWKTIEDKAYKPQPLPHDQATGYYVAPPNERLDGSLYPWGWETEGFPDEHWPAAEELTRATERYARDAPNKWMLVESKIPMEEQKSERLASLREAEGIAAEGDFLGGNAPLTIPAHKRVRLLLDQGHLTTAYPELVVSGGSKAVVNLRYAETLFVSVRTGTGHFDKGNRNEVKGKQFVGPFDTFVPDGRARRLYRPLFWRTYRYLELEVTTAEEPLVIEDLRGTFSGYPFERKGTFTVGNEASNQGLQRILETGWRTARLCAHETYMDCPFYEQLQYAGDARIQMLISLYMSGDSRLMKNGISLLNSSRTAEGATYSRAPSSLPQYIPPFSLWWIGMVHDYWMYVDDPQFVKQMLPGVRAVLEFYAGYQQPSGSLRPMPWWNFVDWVKQWPEGVPPANRDGGSSAALDSQLLLAYQWAADLENGLGNKALGAENTAAADRLKSQIESTDWDAKTGLFADQPEHRTYSQQVNTLAVLAHVGSPNELKKVVEKIIGDPQRGAGTPELAQSSIYFRAYTNAALREVGLGDRYVEMLGPWRQMLSDGLTTWAEWNGPDSRSDCHAWGASPNFELLRTVAGIDSAAPGFARVRIAPNLGNFAEIKAHMPHPRGSIDVALEARRSLTANVDLPEGITGEFVWKGKVHELRPGHNHLKLPR